MSGRHLNSLLARGLVDLSCSEAGLCQGAGAPGPPCLVSSTCRGGSDTLGVPGGRPGLPRGHSDHHLARPQPQHQVCVWVLILILSTGSLVPRCAAGFPGVVELGNPRRNEGRVETGGVQSRWGSASKRGCPRPSLLVPFSHPDRELPPSLPQKLPFWLWAGKPFLARNAHTLPGAPTPNTPLPLRGRGCGGLLLIQMFAEPLGLSGHWSALAVKAWGVCALDLSLLK